MTLYDFISKFITTNLEVYHHVPNDVERQIYKGNTIDFLQKFPRDHIISKVTTFACYVDLGILIVNYIYESDDIEKKLKEGK